MCNLYSVSPKGDAERYIGETAYRVELPDYSMREVGPGGTGVFIRPDGDMLRGVIGRWGMLRPGLPRAEVDKPKFLTNNARSETIATKPTFRAAWKAGQRCLIPAAWLQEPNWETGKNIWWRLRRADGLPWMVAGIWSEWVDRETGEAIPNYAMVTLNVDRHPVLNRLHRPERHPDTKEILPPDQQDKRGEAHIHPADWWTWLRGSEEDALRLLVPPPVEAFDPADAITTDQALAAARGDQAPPAQSPLL